MSSADLSHVDTWLFDLDDTLYPLETGVGFDVSERITDYVERLTGLPRDAARALQKRYLAEHGLTLRGLMLHHGVDPHHYHAMFDDLPLEAIAEDGALVAAIARLPGRKIVVLFTGGGFAALARGRGGRFSSDLQPLQRGHVSGGAGSCARPGCGSTGPGSGTAWARNR